MTDYHIHKVAKDVYPTKTKQFPELPVLFLELLENKEKIRHEVVNKPYEPNPQTMRLVQHMDEILPSWKNHSDDSGSDYADEDSDDYPSYSSSRNGSPNSAESQDTPELPTQTASSAPESNNTHDPESVPLLPNVPLFSSPKESTADAKAPDFSGSEEDSHHSDESMGVPVPPSFQLHDNDDQRGQHREHVRVGGQDTRGHRAPQVGEGVSRGNRNAYIPQLRYSESEIEEEDKKRELLFKLELLRKKNPNAAIPEFNFHSNYQTMLRSYNSLVRQLHVDYAAKDYKRYLMGGFFLVELFLSKKFGLNMEGFTQQQLANMDSYERLLIELGEKSYVDEESQWPVELRLLMLIIMNTGIFILGKIIMRNTGANILNMMNHFMSAGGSSFPGPSATESRGAQRTMRPPTAV